jgi:hypothetical protein
MEQLKAWMDEYIALCDTKKDDWYVSEEGYSYAALTDFYAWLVETGKTV